MSGSKLSRAPRVSRDDRTAKPPSDRIDLGAVNAPTFRDRTVLLHDQRFHYTEWGQSEAPIALLVLGLAVLAGAGVVHGWILLTERKNVT